MAFFPNVIINIIKSEMFGIIIIIIIIIIHYKKNW